MCIKQWQPIHGKVVNLEKRTQPGDKIPPKTYMGWFHPTFCGACF